MTCFMGSNLESNGMFAVPKNVVGVMSIAKNGLSGVEGEATVIREYGMELGEVALVGVKVKWARCFGMFQFFLPVRYRSVTELVQMMRT